MDPNSVKSGQKFKNIFIEETSPENPFGPNYFQLPYNTKIGYKFSKMKGYIRPTRQDLVRKEDQDSVFLGTLLMGLAGGALLGGLGRMFFRRFMPRLDDVIQVKQHIYYPIIISLLFSHCYFRAYDRYYQQVSKYFINKYLKQAIQNGFKDYQISK